MGHDAARGFAGGGHGRRSALGGNFEDLDGVIEAFEQIRAVSGPGEGCGGLAVAGGLLGDELARIVERGAGEEDLSAAGERCEAGGEVGGDAHDVGASGHLDDGDFAGVNTHAHHQSLSQLVCAKPLLKGQRGADGIGGAFEGGEKAVAGVLEDCSIKIAGDGFKEGVVTFQQARVFISASGRFEFGRAHDIGEQQNRQTCLEHRSSALRRAPS